MFGNGKEKTMTVDEEMKELEAQNEAKEESTVTDIPANAPIADETKEEKIKAVEELLNDAVDGMNETDTPTEAVLKTFERSAAALSVRAILKKYANKEIALPLCQRMYVWNDKQRKSLHNSIKKNFTCGSITLAEQEGISYLVDGLQRITSLMLLSNDSSLSKEDRKKILDFKIEVETVFDVDSESMKEMFSILNSGVALASMVKERSKLSKELNDAILAVSKHPFFDTIKDNTTATFNKSHHHELIASNTLLAVAGVAIGENKAKPLCKRLSDNEFAVLSNVDKAIAILDKISEVYQTIPSEIAKRSLNANFVGMLAYALVSKEYDNKVVNQLITYIFGGLRAVKEYSETTGNSAGSTYNCEKRFAVIVNLLENPVIVQEIDEAAFTVWKNDLSVVKSSVDSGIMLDIADLEDCELKALYTASQNNEVALWDKIITNKYNALAG